MRLLKNLYRSDSGEYKLFFATDLHGSEACFRKFLNAAAFYQVHVLVLGGDLTGNRVLPIVDEGGSFTTELFGEEYVLDTAKSLNEFKQKARLLGLYPYVASTYELDELRQNRDYFDETYKILCLESVSRWMEMGEEKLKQSDTRCVLIPGNDDIPDIDPILGQGVRMIDGNYKIVTIDDMQFLGLGESNVTPWKSQRECTEEIIRDHIRQMYHDADRSKPIVFNFHVPPYGSALDDAPILTDDLKMVFEGGRPVVGAVGSHSVRNAIEEFQPALSLHGHVHESRGKSLIGNTHIVNPGSEFLSGILRGVLVTFRNQSVFSTQLTSG